MIFCNIVVFMHIWSWERKGEKYRRLEGFEKGEKTYDARNFISKYGSSSIYDNILRFLQEISWKFADYIGDLFSGEV